MDIVGVSMPSNHNEIKEQKSPMESFYVYVFILHYIGPTFIIYVLYPYHKHIINTPEAMKAKDGVSKILNLIELRGYLINLRYMLYRTKSRPAASYWLVVAENADKLLWSNVRNPGPDLAFDGCTFRGRGWLVWINKICCDSKLCFNKYELVSFYTFASKVT